MGCTYFLGGDTWGHLHALSPRQTCSKGFLWLWRDLRWTRAPVPRPVAAACHRRCPPQPTGAGHGCLCTCKSFLCPPNPSLAPSAPRRASLICLSVQDTLVPHQRLQDSRPRTHRTARGSRANDNCNFIVIINAQASEITGR